MQSLEAGRQKCSAKEVRTLKPSDGSADANIFRSKATLSKSKSVSKELLASLMTVVLTERTADRVG